MPVTFLRTRVWRRLRATARNGAANAATACDGADARTGRELSWKYDEGLRGYHLLSEGDAVVVEARVTGVIPAQTERALTIQTPAEKLTIEKSQITEQKQLPMSLMPEGQLTALGEENVVHLMAYLMSLGPVR